MKILAIGASNNPDSINQALAVYTAGLIAGADVDTLNIDDFEMPIFSDAREAQLGQPAQARAFFARIAAADALIISFAEHNGTYTAAFKNLFDWVSRIDKRVFQGKPAVFLATSPGPGGAASVLATAVDSADYYGADLVDSLSVPNFRTHFRPPTDTIKGDERFGSVVTRDLRLRLRHAAWRLKDRALGMAA